MNKIVNRCNVCEKLKRRITKIESENIKGGVFFLCAKCKEIQPMKAQEVLESKIEYSEEQLKEQLNK